MNHERVNKKKSGLEIAVIGMAGRFPGANSIEAFWDNLEKGVESITLFSTQELTDAGISPQEFNQPSYIRAKGILKGCENFDSAFFNYTPGEARVMEPQVRVFHECTWHALEDAGYDPGTYTGLIGIYAGYHPNLYWNVLSLLQGGESVGEMERQLFNSPFFTTLTSYKLNLKGPSITIHTACSTSLVAIHLACRALLTGETDMAVAGGVCIMQPQVGGYHFREGMIHSSDGHCRSFDHRANGTVPGEGVGLVVLKRLTKALKEGDHIYAIIKGSAVNNDGLRKVGYTAPSVEAQTAVIRSAWRVAGLDIDNEGNEENTGTITYIEAHGSATPLGDPIEIQALKLAFNSKKKQFCRIGSVKSNFGHLDTAAGVAGFIKTVLALYHGKIPASLHFEKANENLDLENSPFLVNPTLYDWNESPHPLRAGVNSFGMGGTNAHILLEEWEKKPVEPTSTAQQQEKSLNHYIFLSAKTSSALDRMTKELGHFLQGQEEMNLADIAYTLQVGRKSFNHRRLVECESIEEASKALLTLDHGSSKDFVVEVEKRPVVFLLPGLGDEYAGMGLGLYQGEPVFRAALDTCLDKLTGLLGKEMKAVFFQGEWSQGNGSDGQGFERAQVMVFCFQYAMAQWLKDWGVTPQAMIGYSFGEYTAACLSGVLTLDDALSLIVYRGRLLGDTGEGAMMSVPLPAGEVQPRLGDNVSLAIDNGDSCVVSGGKDALRELEAKLKGERIMTMSIRAWHGLHSVLMAGKVKSLTGVVEKISLSKPVIPYVSNVTGQWMTGSLAVDPGYWGRHLRETVKFAGGLETLLGMEDAVWIELGPGVALSTLVSQWLNKPGRGRKEKGIDVVNLMGFKSSHEGEREYSRKKMARLWLLGVEMDKRLFAGNGVCQRVGLPGYSFDPHFYPADFSLLGNIMAGVKVSQSQGTGPGGPFYVPGWRAVSGLDFVEKIKAPWYGLVFMDGVGLGEALVESLRQQGGEVIKVKRGEVYEKRGESEYEISPVERSHYEWLFQSLVESGRYPQRVVHLWNITGPGAQGGVVAGMERSMDPGVLSIVYLAEALGVGAGGGAVRLQVVTDHMHNVQGDDLLYPLKAAVLGILRYIPKVYPGLFCSSIDIGFAGQGAGDWGRLLRQITGEILAERVYAVTVYRGGSRMVRTVEPVDLAVPLPGSSLLVKGGVYLVTGADTGAGLLMGEILAQQLQAKLVLLVSRDFPLEEQWEMIGGEVYGDERLVNGVARLRKIREVAGDLKIYRVDVGNREEMGEVKAWVMERYKGFDGIFHLSHEPGGMVGMSLPGEEEAGVRFFNDIQGFYVLDELFGRGEAGEGLGFMVLGSPMGAAIGGPGGMAAPGEVELQAVNACFNALVMEPMRRQGVRPYYISLNWDVSFSENLSLYYLLECALHSGLPRILLTSQDLKGSVDGVGSQGGGLVVKGSVFNEVGKGGMGKGETGESAYRAIKSKRVYEAPRNDLEKVLVEQWQEILGVKPVGIHDNFFEMGGDSLKGMNFVNRFQEMLGEIIHITVVFDAPTIAELAHYFERHYGESVAGWLGQGGEGKERGGEGGGLLTGEMVEGFRRKVYTLTPLKGLKRSGNRPMVFVLSPPRTGSTLLRVMLAGHPGLFAPPELNLMLYTTLKERRQLLGGASSSHLQGTVRAIRQVKGCSLEEAEALMAGYESQGMTVQEFYGMMQGWIGERLLVDKSPGYAMNVEAMKRAELYFDQPYYIHLLRHPYGMIHSYLEARLDLLIGQQLMDSLGLSRERIAELTWTSNELNILECLAGVPAGRQMVVKFEDLVAEPEAIAQQICHLLHLDFDRGMIEPYQDKEQRMTDGLHEGGIMLGDMKFHKHKRIDRGVADNWRKDYHEDFLGKPTRELARLFGYSLMKG